MRTDLPMEKPRTVATTKTDGYIVVRFIPRGENRRCTETA